MNCSSLGVFDMDYESVFRDVLKKEIVVLNWERIKQEILGKAIKFILNRLKGKKISFDAKLLIPDRLVILQHPVFRKLCAGEGVWPNILGQIRKIITKELQARGLVKKLEEIISDVENEIKGLMVERNIKGRELRALINDLLRRKLYESGVEEELESLYFSLDDLFEGDLAKFIAMKFMDSIRKSREGLRPFIIPGSITRGKAFNLYYGEGFESEELVQLASALLNSICIGDSIAVYFEGGEIENIMDEIKERILTGKFGARHVGRDLFHEFWIRPTEDEKPYIVLAKFLLKIIEFYKVALEESRADEAEILSRIVRDIKDSYGLLYVVPDFKGERSIIPLPKLDRFIGSWLENDEKRNVIKGFLCSLYNFFGKIYFRARREKKSAMVENAERVLVNYLELFLRTLIEYNTVHWQSLREMTDILLQLSINFDTPIDLWFIKRLELMY